MAITNKSYIVRTLNIGLMHLSETKIPVTTTDDIATAITVEDGEATGFTSLSDLLDVNNSNLVKTAKQDGNGYTSIVSIVGITDEAYTNLATKDNNTLYIITE